MKKTLLAMVLGYMLAIKSPMRKATHVFYWVLILLALTKPSKIHWGTYSVSIGLTAALSFAAFILGMVAVAAWYGSNPEK